MEPDVPWQEFEAIVEKLHRAFYSGAVIQRNDRILGQNSNRRRQIDISIRQKLGLEEILIIVECKRLNRKMGVSAVEAFVGLREDVRADVGLLVSASGFTKSAREVAERKKISLYSIRDTEAEDWPNGFRVPATFLIWYLRPENFRIISERSERIPVSSNTTVTVVDGELEERGAIKYFLRDSWLEDDSRTERVRRVYEVSAKSKTTGQERIFFECDLTSKLVKILRVGRFHFVGLVAEGTKSAHAQEFRIDVEDGFTILEEGEAAFRENGGYGFTMETACVDEEDFLKCLRLFAETPHSLQVGLNGAIEIPLN